MTQPFAINQPVEVPVEQSVLLKRFKAFYANLAAAEWAELDNLYAETVHFCDPVHRIEGRCALHHYMVALCEDLLSCRFEYLDEVVTEGRAYIKWDMHFVHPKLGKQEITVRGVSQLEFSGDGIIYHEDFYDMGAMLYQQLPVLGSVIRWLKNRLARSV